MIEVNRNGEVWVFAEQEDGQLSEVPLELLGKARELAETLGVAVAAVLLGEGVSALADELFRYGADKVYVAEDKRLGHYQAAGYRKVICDLIEQYKPQVMLYGATAIGRDLAPTVASAAKCGLTADCTDLQIGDHKPAGSDVTHKNLMLQIRPAFGGNIIATIVNFDRWPQMATVREGVMAMPDPDAARKGEVVSVEADLDGVALPLTLIEHQRRAKRVNLKAARIIVAGGAGVGTSGTWPTAWAARSPARGRRWTWVSWTTITRWARPARRCARRCTSPAASAARSSTERAWKTRPRSWRSTLTRTRRSSAWPITESSGTSAR